jgi:hypothetical protein
MYEWYFMYKDIVPEKTRKHEVAFQGTPPPTPQYAAHRSAQRGFPRRLGPFRGTLETLNEISQSFPMVCFCLFRNDFIKILPYKKIYAKIRLLCYNILSEVFTLAYWWCWSGCQYGEKEEFL